MPSQGVMRGRASGVEGTSMLLKRLNWGCGPVTAPGWINSDRCYAPGVDLVCDIRAGLPLESDLFDYIVSIHALPQLAYGDLDPVLRELRRVLKPQGILRLGLPDMDKAIQAYLRNDRDYFLVPDKVVHSTSGKMITQLLWYGFSYMMFTHEFTKELLEKAGFHTIRPCRFKESCTSYPDIVALDNRERESLFVEAIK